MTEIILCGCNGKMGRTVAQKIETSSDCVTVAGVDVFTQTDYRFPVYTSFKSMKNYKNAVIVDFSHPAVLNDLLEYAIKNKLPCVICTTGLSSQQVEQIKEASKEIAIFYSGNMSLGINLTIALSKLAAKTLGDEFDVEIIEKHHNLKLDAPSGTALMIADALSNQYEDEKRYVYDRHITRKKRDKKEIGIHSVRGGTIVGEHEVVFAGNDEVVSIKHTAQSKNIFAVGAVNAAIFISDKKSGMFDMSDLILSKK